MNAMLGNVIDMSRMTALQTAPRRVAVHVPVQYGGHQGRPDMQAIREEMERLRKQADADRKRREAEEVRRNLMIKRRMEELERKRLQARMMTVAPYIKAGQKTAESYFRALDEKQFPRYRPAGERERQIRIQRLMQVAPYIKADTRTAEAFFRALAEASAPLPRQTMATTRPMHQISTTIMATPQIAAEIRQQRLSAPVRGNVAWARKAKGAL
jgi:hypothetical protein